MQGFASVFFQMGARQVDGFDVAFAFLFDDTIQFAADDNRFFELADLVAFRQIGIKVIFAGENRNRSDFCADTEIYRYIVLANKDKE